MRAHAPYLTEAAAQFLTDTGARLVGIDSVNIDQSEGGERPAHSLLLGAGIPVLEYLTGLGDVPISGARLHAVPPRVKRLAPSRSGPTHLFPRRGDMDVYLMQHGKAAAEADDPARPLTDDGRAVVTRVAARAQSAGVRIDRCLHSGKLRAEQTAQILAASVGSTSAEKRDGLAPNDAIGPMAEWLRGRSGDESIAVVGHLPYLDRLASALVAGDESAQVVSFQMGGLVKLVPKADRDGFAIAWVLALEIT
jgi:phosphohistidine phosphatase